MPKVSIILTSYNHEKYISYAIESALAQTFTDFELIIVDDCSTDDSWEIIRQYNDPRIVPIRFDQNTYRPVPMAVGYTKGEYIAIHHSDDVWEPEKLQKQVDYMESHPEIAACFTLVQFMSEAGDDYTPPENTFYYNRFDQPNRNRFEWLRFFWEEGNALCHPSAMIRKDIYEKCKLSFFGMIQMPDFFRWIRICLSCEIYILPEKLTRFRLRINEQTNISADRIDTQIRSATEYFFVFDELFKISNKDIFFKIFPEYASQDVVPEFVLSERLMKKGFPTAQFYALNKIFSLLNNPEIARNIEAFHNYTYIDFIKDTGNHDIFGTKLKSTFLNASIYIDYGNGYNEIDRIAQTVYVGVSNSFYAKFTLPDQKEIVELRFDPDEQRLWDISLDSIMIDGIKQSIKPFNTSIKTDEYDSFFSYDPAYIISCFPKCKVLEIRGRVRPLSINACIESEAKLNLITNSRTLNFFSRFTKVRHLFNQQ